MVKHVTPVNDVAQAARCVCFKYKVKLFTTPSSLFTSKYGKSD